MNEMDRELFEERVSTIARKLEYPPTPDFAGRVMSRLHKGARLPAAFPRLAWSAAILALLFAGLMAVPAARAAILEFIQIGAVRIFGSDTSPTPTFAPVTATPPTLPGLEVPSTALPVTATAISTYQDLIPLLEHLAGGTTLDEARQAVGYPILLPSYPPGLDKPDLVFVQEADGKMTVLVWMDRESPGRVRMSLHFLPSRSWAVTKFEPRVIRETSVHGARAVWTVGPYPLRLSDGDIDVIRLIEGHVLIWTDGEVTYRLETDETMEEAVRIAESLESIQ